VRGEEKRFRAENAEEEEETLGWAGRGLGDLATLRSFCRVGVGKDQFSGCQAAQWGAVVGSYSDLSLLLSHGFKED